MSDIERQPPYQQIAARIRARIEAGEVQPGDRVASDSEIATEFGVSRATAQKVLATLRSERVIEPAPGARGNVVSLPAHLSGRDRATAVRLTGRIYTEGEYARIVSAELTPAPDSVASALGIEAGAPAIRRLRITFGRDDKPRSASVSWYDGTHSEAAPLLLVQERIKAGSWAYLEQQTGLQAVQGQDVISARLATEEDAELLGITLPAAVKESVSILRTADGTVVEYGVSIAGEGRQSSYDYDLS
ncbi:GntR family transcriptional regulator [Kitasatospora sp. NPDC058478]|uniref:GntR family transcriptional regulator n=1 Tax=unclassified Kitasatospora TaxID=2633591 RepID=UPI00365EDDB3